jgi:hypothetical protein
MEYLILLTVPFVSVFFGYLYEKHNIDPNTPEGKIYYSTGESNNV